MKNLFTMLAGGLFTVCTCAWGQLEIPAKPDPSIKTPSEPGMQTAPAPSVKAPSNSGVIVVPPKTGTEEMVTTPKNVDPEINSATDDIDKKNRKKSEDKTENKKKAK